MRPSSLLALALALAVGGGVGWWIRRERAAAREQGVVPGGDRDPASPPGEAPPRADGSGGPDEEPDGEPAVEGPTGPKPFPMPANPKDGERVLVVTPADLGTPESGPKGPPKVLVPGHEDALREVDWTAAGRQAVDVPGLAAALARKVAETGNVPQDLAGRLGASAGVLSDLAERYRVRLGAERFATPNAAFTHPPFAANVIASTLEAAGKPLSEEKLGRLAELARVYAEKERAGRPDPSAFALAVFLEQATTREEFYVAAAATLDDAQKAALWPEEAKGRLHLDLFSSSLLWTNAAQHLRIADREGLVARLTDAVIGGVGIPEDRRPVVKEAMEELVAGLPAAMLDAPADPVSLRGFLPLAGTVEVAKRWVVALERIVRLGRLDEDTAARVRNAKPVLFPVREPEPK